MRILHLVSYPLFSGPIPPTVNLALAQRRAGHTVWLGFDTQRGNFDGYEEAAAPALAGLGLAPPVSLTLSTHSSLMQLWRDRQALRTLCQSGAVDVVHAHFSHDHALMAALGRVGVRRIRTFHAARSLQRRFGQSLLNGRADGWIVRCARHKDTLVHAFKLPAGHVAVIPGSIDAQAFVPATALARAAARQQFGVPSEAPLVGHVALLARRGQEELLQAAAAVGPDTGLHVLLVGKGEREAALRELAAQLNIAPRVHFVGYLPGTLLGAAYAAMDAAYLAQAGNDGSARAALEAMAAGLPVLGVQDAALGELVDAQRGYPIAQRTAEEVAEALCTWLRDMAHGRRRGAAARQFVAAQRRIDDEAAATVALYDRAGR